MVVSFLGAGASAPFGIPTMQSMVPQFEAELTRARATAEAGLYAEICLFLRSTIGRPVDLEAVFTVVDSIIDWSPDRMGISALYHASRAALATDPGPDPGALRVAIQRPGTEVIGLAQTLRRLFEEYVQKSCRIPDGQGANIERVYDALFQSFSAIGGVGLGGRKRGYVGVGAMFTTNYDAVLEHFWLDVAEAPLETGFEYDNVSRMNLSKPERLVIRNGFRLYKLHGSITWLDDPRYGLAELQEPPQEMRTFTGRKFRGQVMLYPIEEKTLYMEPYLTMYQMLNRELRADKAWVVVGYSFGDRVIRDIFLRNSADDSRIVLVHPRASEILDRLEGMRGKRIALTTKFGEGDLKKFTQDVTDALRA